MNRNDCKKRTSSNRAKVLCLLLISILLSVCLVVVFELVLRFCGYGYNPHFFQKETIDGVECYTRNPAFSWRFFPKPMARLSTALRIPKEKPPGVIRVFILGASAAMGDPEPTFGFSRILDVMLHAKYPGKKIEVYNTAATAINSNVVLPIARDCLDLQPDLFVIYCGNNEVIGPFGLSAALTPFFSSRSFIKAQVWLGETRIGQMLKSFSQKNGKQEGGWKGMELFLEQKISHQDPNLEKIYSHFSDNIAEICDLARKSRVRVVLSTVIVNDLDCAPFVSVHRSSLDATALSQWEGLYQRGLSDERAGQWKAACDSYEQATAIDSDYAELQYRLGHCYLKLNRTNNARTCLENARDDDTLRFRADSRLNEAIGKVARVHGAFYIPAQSFAEQASPYGLPGTNFLYEHVHLNFEGNYLLASRILTEAEKALDLRGGGGCPSIAECKKQLAFTAFDEKRIFEDLQSRFQRAPFSGQSCHAADMAWVKDRLATLEVQVQKQKEAEDRTYREALAARPSDWQIHMNYLKFLFAAERFNEAYEQAVIIYKELPSEYFSLMNMGVTLQKIKRYEEAERFLNQTIQSNPFLTEGYEKMGFLLEEEQKYAEAEAAFKKRNNPHVLAAFYNRVGERLARKHDSDQAREYFNRALAVRPGYSEVLSNLESLDHPVDLNPENSEAYRIAIHLIKQERFNKAAEAFDKVIREYPSFVKARNNYGFVLVKTGRYDDAVAQFSEAVRLAPNLPDGYQNLASLYGLQKKHAEAINMLKKLVSLKPTRRFYEFLADEYAEIGNTNEAQKVRETSRMCDQ